jgi:[acyl-carrier-protein] S-malonyltransferase
MNRDDRVAFVFPGQGSQAVGMGRGLYDDSAAARSVFEEADEVLGFHLSRMCFEGPEDVLRQTVNAQPAILTVSIAYLSASPGLEGVTPSYVAGHSLGEYTALAAAGVLRFREALHLARERGRLMQQAGEHTAGGMVAILGLDEAVIEDVCRRSGTQIANLNCPGQVAVSGPIARLDEATRMAKAAGAHRVIALQVSGAFHSPLMAPVVEGMEKAVSKFDFSDASIPIVANTTARPLNGAADVKEELLQQLCHCVRWQASIEFMIAEGVSTFIEVGPGQVLTGLIKRINKDVQTVNLDSNRR